MSSAPDARRLWSVDERYVDAQGRMQEVDEHRRRSVEAAIEATMVGPANAPPPLVIAPDAQVELGRRARLVLEDGRQLDIVDRLPPGLPLGYHQLETGDDPGRRVIVTPGQCHLPEWFPAWGWSVQLYALRSRRSWGVGDLDDLRRFGHLAASQGAKVVLVNPLHATAAVPPIEASPYSPSSRRFLSPLWLAVDRLDEIIGAAHEPVGPPPEAVAVAAAGGVGPRGLGLLQRDPAFRAKLAALEQRWTGFSGHPDFERFRREGGDALTRFGAFCALSERYGPDWRAWPDAYRHPGNPAVARFTRDDPRGSFHVWAQWLTQRQLGAAAEEVGLIQDLPVGFDASGADAWESQDLVVDSYTIGAPPDVFQPRGQNWGLPVFSPPALAAAGYQPFIETIRAGLRHAAGLRIDHVMGLFRQWWVPAGGSPADGAYVRFPAADLLDVVALESHRARAFVVGEDLGTVEEAVRAELGRRRLLSYRLLWFEDEPPPRWPPLSLGAVSTHDLPTVAGVWTGADAREQVELGVTKDGSATEALRRRLAQMAGIDPSAPVTEAVDAAHRLLASAASDLVAVSLDDALEVPERPNLPGCNSLRPNWSIPLPQLLDDLEGDPRVSRVAEIMASRSDGCQPDT
jgi:4-alpha-glucanotransferase